MPKLTRIGLAMLALGAVLAFWSAGTLLAQAVRQESGSVSVSASNDQLTVGIFLLLGIGLCILGGARYLYFGVPRWMYLGLAGLLWLCALAVHLMP